MRDPHSKRRPWTRRDVLKGTAGAMAGLYGFSSWRALAAIPNEYDGTKFQLKAAEPNAKSGGVLRYGITSRAPHFDVHQSGTINSLGSQGCMFDNLIRRDPRDSGQTIIPDLAHSWEIAKDGKTYTFLLRKDVLFHDGAEFTSEDVKATFDRIIKPPSGISIPRSTLFSRSQRDHGSRQAHGAVQAVRAASPCLHHGGDRQRLECHRAQEDPRGQRLQSAPCRDLPRHGPYKSQRRVENEVWVMEKNKDYWNKGLPYLDGIEFYHALPFSPELGSALLSGRTDYARLLDPGSLRKVKATQGMNGTDFYQSVIQGTWMNNKKKPMDDPRVRRAFHLVLDKAVLVDVVKDVAPMMVGGFIYPFSEFATPKAELEKRLGYQADPTAAVKEARALMAAAGHANGIKGLDYLVREVASFRLWSQAIQAMLQQTLNVECKLRTVVELVWFDDIKTGNYDLAIGAIVSTLLDPSDYFNAWYRKDGPQNYSSWDNAAFNELLPQIDREVDAAKRLALIRKAEDIMEQDPPVLPMSWEKINDGWYNYVKGHNPKDYFGIYDVVRMDTMWLDK